MIIISGIAAWIVLDHWAFSMLLEEVTRSGGLLPIMAYNVVFTGLGKRKDRNNNAPRLVSPMILFTSLNLDYKFDLRVDIQFSEAAPASFTPKVCVPLYQY
jgi:hypothetical protein